MAPNTTSVSHKYSRSELLKLRDFNNDGSHIDWSHVDAVLSPHSVQNIRGIKARITSKPGDYTDIVPGTQANNLQWLPTHYSITINHTSNPENNNISDKKKLSNGSLKLLEPATIHYLVYLLLTVVLSTLIKSANYDS